MKRGTLDIVKFLVRKLHSHGIERTPAEVVGYAKGLSRTSPTKSTKEVLQEAANYDSCYQRMLRELIRLG